MKIEDKIRSRAIALGFELFGVANTHVDESDRKFFGQWLADGKGANMSKWLERSKEKRGDPNEILRGVKSVIVVGMNYYPGDHQVATGKVARYAWGMDYHKTMGAKLFELAEYLNELGDPESKWYVDTGAVFERYFAVKAGLGFIGKNTCLITKKFGSWVFIGSLLTTLVLREGERGSTGRCGSCRKCIDACPTGALSEKCLDARKCISYLTIEKRGAFTEGENKMVACQNFCFGCDICQEICPHNVKQKKTTADLKGWTNLSLKDIPENAEKFNKKFRGSPIRRAKFAGILRNLKVTLPH